MWPHGGAAYRPPEEMACDEQLAPHDTGFPLQCRSGWQRWVDWSRNLDVLEMGPAVEVARRVDCAVVSEMQQAAGMNFEVQMRRGREGIPGVSDEADYLSRTYSVGAQNSGRVSRQMGVVELVTGRIAHPQPPAAELFPSDSVDRATGDRDDWSSKRREDVVAVMPIPSDVATKGTVGVAVLGCTYHRKDIAPRHEWRSDLERPMGLPHMPRRPPDLPGDAVADGGRKNKHDGARGQAGVHMEQLQLQRADDRFAVETRYHRTRAAREERPSPHREGESARSRATDATDRQ